ncbi:high frequency lysogenization protein [Cricetibacter osteomyelitidis]|uniref:High frequency lysogenization protein HflD homolog n=1 Tax=Cricetibacter osteomyelitidis TaxID=1521931 RepID=A0A4R2T6P2_9PAST|nr:high frequency lysogenization protein HflD [Cricetibacter osteomyelitidis]TCP96534.1 high frequency lysogenization protein [Cricetibacter osteomyelitidis]
MANFYDITLALAGICQAAKLVQQFAHKGQADLEAFEQSLQTLLVTSPKNTLHVFGGNEANLHLGLTTLLEQINNGNAGELEMEVGRYWLSLLALEGKLNKNPEAKSELARRMQYLPNQTALFELTDQNMIDILGGIYVDVISPLGSRINVTGSALYLQQPAMQSRVRACLLAGMRAAVLWRQVGGTKWQMLFSRRKIATQAQQILSSL